MFYHFIHFIIPPTKRPGGAGKAAITNQEGDMANYNELAKTIIELVGGKENVTNLGHCATRLRFNLKDDSKAKIEDLKATKGVLGVANQGGQYQVIIGPHVKEVCSEILTMLDLRNTSEKDGEKSGSNEEAVKKGPVEKALDIIAGSVFPLIPALAGTGMVKALLTILTVLGVVDNASETYRILNMMADAAYYFMPVLIAFSAAKKFQVNEYVAATIGAVLVSPTLSSLFSAATEAGTVVKFFGIPVTKATYSNSLIPILLIVWLMSYVEPFFNRVVPKVMRTIFVPMFTILVVTPIGLIALGPIGTWLGNGLAAIIMFLDVHVAWLVPTLMGAFTPLLVMVGMHYGIIPIGINLLATTGEDIVAGPGMLVSNIAQGGASLAVAVKAKNSDIKSLGTSCGISAICGITEPAMYGVSMRFGNPLKAAMIGGGVAGFFMGIFHVARFAQVAPSIFALPSYISPEGSFDRMILAAAGCLIAFVVSFAVSYFLGVDESK